MEPDIGNVFTQPHFISPISPFYDLLWPTSMPSSNNYDNMTSYDWNGKYDLVRGVGVRTTGHYCIYPRKAPLAL